MLIQCTSIYMYTAYRTMEFTKYDRKGYTINYLRAHPPPPLPYLPQS